MIFEAWKTKFSQSDNPKMTAWTFSVISRSGRGETILGKDLRMKSFGPRESEKCWRAEKE